MKLRKKREDSSWEQLYEERDVESLPWYLVGLDPDFAEALDTYGLGGGAVLDLCTGPGTQAIALAERGFKVTAMDIANAAVKKACLKAREQGLQIEFQQDNILDTHMLAGAFDVVMDRGCFHVFPAGKRVEYVPSVRRLLKPGGYLLLKCFSHLETRPEGPYRIAPEEIERLFSEDFEILAIKHTHFSGDNLKPPPKALFCAMRKR